MDLAEVLILVDGAQISKHEVGGADGLAPGAGDLDVGEVNLLSDGLTIGRRAWHERGQLLSHVHHDRCSLLIESSGSSEPDDIATALSHDHGVRVACRYLDSLITIHLAFLKENLSRGEFRLISSVT